ncbi:MAG: esterase [Rubrivivax sp.]|nr:esterase [Rubrivivax sp.]
MHPNTEWLPSSGAAEQLIVLLHGQGAGAETMAPLALALRAAFPQAAVLAPAHFLLADDAAGDAAASDALQHWLQAQQQRLGVGAPATALGGLGRGAVRALALVLRHDGIAGRVLAFGGAFVQPPEAAPRLTTLHFFHGEADPVMPAEGARQALQRLSALQGDATLDIAAGVGHELHPALIQRALHRLQTHIPLRTWQAALGAAQAAAPPPAG